MAIELDGAAVLAPLTKGGNLPFRRLCAELGARITTSEMAYARQIVRRSRSELALLRRHPSEPCFGVQLAVSRPEEAVAAGRIAVERGAEFVDINAGCPIHDVVRRGMGATLLQRPAALARVVAALAAELPVPVTVKLRSGWSQSEVNAIELGRAVESAGAAAVTLHARTREQRYTKAADWNLIGELVASLSIPVLGNGDLLTHYEVRWRRQQSGCAGVMLGRGALIKPWLFREIAEERAVEPTALQRVALYHRLTGYFREHFGDDDRGRERAMRFLPWHFGFFCRYRPLPESRWAEAAARHPLLQTRWSDDDGEVPLLEAVLRDPRPEMHEHIARALWDAASDAHAAERLEALGRELPPQPGPADEVAVAHG